MLGVAGCGALEYYGPLPNLRELVLITGEMPGRPEKLEIRGRTISREAAWEIRILNTATDVTISNCTVEDGGILLQSLARLPFLKRLRLEGLELEDGDLAHLADASTIEDLELYHTTLVEEDFATLASLPLKSLGIASLVVTEEVLQPLAEFQQLEELFLSLPALQVSALPSFAKLDNLAKLTILHSDFTHSRRSQLRVLAEAAHLRKIYISSPTVDDRVLRVLAGSHNLQEIRLGSGCITDRGIRYLETLDLYSLSVLYAERLSRDSLLSLSKHPNLHTLRLDGIPLPQSDQTLLANLDQLTDFEIGMSEQELEEYYADLAAGMRQPYESYRTYPSRPRSARRADSRETTL